MKIGSITSVIFFLVIAVLSQTTAVYACSCVVVPRAVVYKGSDVVVVGRVVGVKVVGKLRHAQVKVSKTIKGSAPSNNIIEFVTKLDDAQCGYRFKVRNKPLTIAANSKANGTHLVNKCTMYSLKRADRKDSKIARKKSVKEVQKAPETKIVTVSCLADSQTGSAACNAICPEGRTVLSCAQNVGSFAPDDTCTAISHMFSGPADPNGRLGAQPNDRCRVSAKCSNKKQKLSAQAWASCVRP